MTSQNKTTDAVIFYQVPKILTQQNEIKGDHIYIFMILYEKLRQQISWNKTSKLTNVGLRQLKTKLNDLEKWGFLSRNGRNYSM